jgi:hypothetical protein
MPPPLARMTSKKNIVANLKAASKAEGIAVADKFYDLLLGKLLEGLSKKYDTGVVFLVDENDTPVTDHTGEPDLAQTNAKVLHNFYRALKNNLKYHYNAP